jgi:hypothetical protein
MMSATTMAPLSICNRQMFITPTTSIDEATGYLLALLRLFDISKKILAASSPP